jgi:hypothetical protein
MIEKFFELRNFVHIVRYEFGLYRLGIKIYEIPGKNQCNSGTDLKN